MFDLDTPFEDVYAGRPDLPVPADLAENLKPHWPATSRMLQAMFPDETVGKLAPQMCQIVQQMAENPGMGEKNPIQPGEVRSRLAKLLSAIPPEVHEPEEAGNSSATKEGGGE